MNVKLTDTQLKIPITAIEDKTGVTLRMSLMTLGLTEMICLMNYY